MCVCALGGGGVGMGGWGPRAGSSHRPGRVPRLVDERGWASLLPALLGENVVQLLPDLESVHKEPEIPSFM